MDERFLGSKRNRSLIGLAGAVPIAVVGVVFFQGTLMWALLAVAAFDVVFTPYMLSLVADGPPEQPR
ncbi:MAG: hypothetical protein V5A25_05375 [Halovenus sp.]